MKVKDIFIINLQEIPRNDEERARGDKNNFSKSQGDYNFSSSLRATAYACARCDRYMQSFSNLSLAGLHALLYISVGDFNEIILWYKIKQFCIIFLLLYPDLINKSLAVWVHLHLRALFATFFSLSISHYTANTISLKRGALCMSGEECTRL